MNPADVTLAILAGGKGTRLGGVMKGLIEVEGRTVIERLLDLRPLASEVLLSGVDPALQRFGLPQVADLEPFHGPPAGVVSLLLRASTPWVLVVACDSPYVSVEVVRPLLEAADDATDVVLFEAAGRFDPFPGLYRRALALEWKKVLPSNPSLQALLRGVKTRLVTRPVGRALEGINTPEELERARGRLPGR
jgi:molybdopterin-guanine dinucleotide biosynthesis protein A